MIKFDCLCSFKEHYTGKAKIKYSSCDFASFTEDWENENWDDKFEGMDIDNMWNCFSQYYHESVEKYLPKYIPKKECRPKPQWMTADSLINWKVWILTICGIVSLNIIMKVLKNMYQNIFPKKDVNPNLNG